MKAAFERTVSPNTRNSLIVGSAPSAAKLAHADLRHVRTIAVNNAWRVRGDFEFSIFSDDFPDDRKAPAGYPAALISAEEYLPAMNMHGGLIFCGATMALAAGYWAFHTLPSPVIGFYASDMVYGRGQTHFYGTGSPDPLRDDISLGNLEALSVRMFCLALQNGKLLVNCSAEPESRLLLPRRDLKSIRDPFIFDSMHWGEVLMEALAIRRAEQLAPFDANRSDYWNLADTEDKRDIIFATRERWAALIPLVKEVLSKTQC